MWVKWVNLVYLKGVDFWLYVVKNDVVWYWRKINKIKYIVRLFIDDEGKWMNRSG